ncbi:MAG TPA: ATP-binding protein, partial [bacterium]|nr:ATP-binding protein [bacterium]
MARMQHSILNSGRIKFREVRFVRKDGSLIYCDVRGNAQALGDRTIGFAILQDVSSRRRAQSQIQAERARFRALLKGVPDVMLRITGDGKIVDAHYEHPENFPVPMSAVLGLAVKDIPAPPHLVELALNTIRTALETGEPQFREYVLPMPDGRQLIQEGRMMKSGEDEIVATIRDVTEARQAENHRIAAARAESIKLMGRGLAHDVANALVPVGGYIEFALRLVNDAREARSPLPLEKLDKLAEDLEIANEWAGRLRDMVSGFRELSTEPAKGAPFDLQQLLDPTTLRAMLGSNVELRVRHSAEPWPVPGPQQNIQRVIQNLVGNANDAMQGRPGVLRVEVDRVVLSSEDLRRLSAPDVVNRHGGNFTRLRIQDTGDGIAPENLQRIFEPYFSTKPREEGAGHGGLGLSLVDKLVRDGGGFISVESYVGIGTTFDLYLPFVQPPPPSTEVIRNLPEIHSKTILVVSPDPALHESVQSTLGERGFSRLLLVPGYQQAVETAASLPGGIDALLTDFRLPDNMYGVKLMEALRVNSPNLPTIIWTEHDASAYTNVAGAFGKVMGRSTVNSQLGPTLEGLISLRLLHRD